MLAYLLLQDLLSTFRNHKDIVNIEQNILIIFLPCGSLQKPDPYIGVYLGRRETQMAHTIPKVVPKISSCNFATIQSTADKCKATNIFKAKFQAANKKMLFRTRGLKVHIPDIGSPNWEAEQCSVHQGNTNTLPRNQPSKAGSRRVGRRMPIFNPMRFSCEIHFNIKDNVPRGFVPPWRRTLIGPKDLECNTYVAHFLGEGISPKPVPILLVDLDHFLNRSR
jgi:hypothetical protein